MKCLRCGNEEDRYFWKDGDVFYCRKCIMFGRIDAGDLPTVKPYMHKKYKGTYKLQYPLTPYQKKASEQILSYLKRKEDVLVYAACGAGKTELTMEAITMYLRAGKKVGFAISRRQVVLEICDRMRAAFSDLHVVAVCEGYTKVVDGDLIICTMHQLYRYHQSFDLLIMDEIDAFPYRDNEVLKHIAQHACKGEKLMLTATPDEALLQQVEKGEIQMVELFQRPHGYPLIVPEVKTGSTWKQIWYVIHFLLQQRKQDIQTLLFVPTIAMANSLYRIFHYFFRCAVLTSKTEGKEACIAAFHEKKYEFLISTTILERGITIKGIYVVILHADHPVFNEASLIQMIGRVGRNMEMPTGKGLFLCTRKTNDIKRCIRAIRKMNETIA